MPGSADRILRLLFNEHIQKKILVRDLLKIFDQMDDRTESRMTFEPVEGGWKKPLKQMTQWRVRFD